MSDRLVIDEIAYELRIAWYLEEEGEIGLVLGEGCARSKKAPSDPEEWEAWVAEKMASKSAGVQHDDHGFYWESRKEAAAALQMIEAQWKNRTRPLQDWEKKAVAAGWKPPKGWK